MKKKNIISLAGELASGKGTVSKLLSEELEYTIYRNGEYVRKLENNRRREDGEEGYTGT